MQETANPRQLWHIYKTPLLTLVSLVAMLWFIEFIDWLHIFGTLDRYGIRPRTLIGLWGILWAPFLHGGFGHLLANTGPLLLLGSVIIISRGMHDWLSASGIIILLGGLGTWLIGPANSVHIGASGLIFGYFGFLLLLAYFEHSCRNLMIAGLVVFLYGGLIWGILPGNNGISWQSHFFGLFGGIVAAYFLARREPATEVVMRITEDDLY